MREGEMRGGVGGVGVGVQSDERGTGEVDGVTEGGGSSGHDLADNKWKLFDTATPFPTSRCATSTPTGHAAVRYLQLDREQPRSDRVVMTQNEDSLRHSECISRPRLDHTTHTKTSIDRHRRSNPEKLAKKLSSLSSATEDQEERESCLRKFTSCRWVIGYMCCAARFAQSAIRQCIGLAVVCMTLHSGTHVADPTVATGVFGQGGNETWEDGVANSSGEAEVTVAEFVWSPQYEGLILNGFNIGFLFSPILGGHIAGRFGGKRVVAVALLGGGLTTIFLPMAARCNDIFVIILRITTGMFLGAVDPAIQALWAKWAPKQEKAQLTTCSYTGLSLAGVLTFFVSGYLCDIDIDNGWPFIFYFFGMFALLCLPPWMLLVYDSPAQHPRILDNEKLKTPWRGMMTSTAFWAIIVAHVTYTWVTSWMMSYLPKYLKEKMKFDIKENGLYSSLPYVGRLLSGFLAGYLSDFITSRNKFTTAKTRKIFQVVGCIGCAVCMQAVGFLDHTWRGAAVVLLVLAISFQNLTSVAFRINHLDIAPRFAGVMMGMTVTAAMLISLTGPPITAAIIKTS
ncbi:hypothetical protein BaRGS_00007975, partial [Batillaria attramentaria]